VARFQCWSRNHRPPCPMVSPLRPPRTTRNRAHGHTIAGAIGGGLSGALLQTFLGTVTAAIPDPADWQLNHGGVSLCSRSLIVLDTCSLARLGGLGLRWQTIENSAWAGQRGHGRHQGNTVTIAPCKPTSTRAPAEVLRLALRSL
jgi:hypothetical protein